MQIKDYAGKLHRYGGEGSVFEASDVDDADAVQYFGFLNTEGYWIIQKYDTSTSPKTMRYAAGTADYATAWTARASLAFGYYNAIP